MYLVSFIQLVESAWIDIDYMDNMKDFTVDNVKFPQDRMIKFGKDLHDRGQKYIVMVDPAINANTTYEPYARGTEMDVFLKSPDGSQFIGSVWPG
jgi:alpha-glucosidase